MGLVLPTDCLLRWKSSCDSRYPCFFQMVTCIIAYEGPILSWIFGRFGWVWIYVSVGVYVFVFFGNFFNILHLTEPWNLNEQRLPKKRFDQLLQHSKAPPSRTGYKRNMAKYVVGCTFFGFPGRVWLACFFSRAFSGNWFANYWRLGFGFGFPHPGVVWTNKDAFQKQTNSQWISPMECLRRAGNSRAFEQGLECL